MSRRKYKTEKHDGVLTEPYKVAKTPEGKYEYREIQAFQCCNSDGTHAGYLAGTPEGDRWLIERRFIPTKGQVKFTNFWRYDKPNS